MRARLSIYLVPVLVVGLATEVVAGQADTLLWAQSVHDIARGPGGYLAWHKLLLIALAFQTWVKLTDWINRDSQKIGQDLNMIPEIWNPISLGSLLLGFTAAMLVPIFWVGFPVMLLCAFTPFSIYFLVRRAKFLETPTLKNKLSNDPVVATALPQDDGVAVKFTAAGASNEDRQKNLIRARRAESFIEMKNLIGYGAKKRAELILLDFTRDHVASRMLIDGAWHPLAPLSRPVGDSMLAGLKCLAGLNPSDRRGRQHGQFSAVVSEKKLVLDLLTQGVKTGERAQLKFVEQRKINLMLPQLGMWPEMIGSLIEYTAKPGIVLISAPPEGGLTTTWRALLAAVDRITRDWVAIIDNDDRETEVENVAVHRFDKAGGKKLDAVMRRVLLTQPDALVVPDIRDAGTLDKLVEETQRQGRTVLTRTHAVSAAEALVKLWTLAGSKNLFAQSINCVLGQKLARRLCDACKVGVQVKPQLIQQLGGDPKKSTTLYNPYKLPPVEQRVDENGKPVEMLPCSVCNGIGYIGRVSIFELIRVTPEIREVLVKRPQVELIRRLADQAGDLPMLKQGYRLVLLGITSVAEIQRVMKA